jgi:uncharacterized protein (TIGR03000 family)
MRISILPFTLVAVLSGLTLAGRVEAQTFGVGIGIYSGPRYPAYPYFGAYPLAYRGFYGNGMSMYGPPVPTYGPIPGTFGGSDYRVNQNAPYIGFPVGIYASYSKTRAVVDGNGEPPLLNPDAVRSATANNALLVEIRVPLDNVIVFINDQLTKQNGNVRYFSSPPLKPGETYQYTIRAVWTIDGQRNDKTLTLQGKPGERMVADFLR